MTRSYYSNTYSEFMASKPKEIIGEMALNDPHQTLLDTQKNAWLKQIKILQEQFENLSFDRILFEYSIPRMGKRVDNILIKDGVVYVLEFKVGAERYNSSDLSQTEQYALDLTNFQKESKDKKIIPILVASDASSVKLSLEMEDNVAKPICANSDNLRQIIEEVSSNFDEEPIDAIAWEDSIYQPTPTTIEAALALYTNHSVEEITRTDAGERTFRQTTQIVEDIIEDAKKNNKKNIIFVTGVPGSGKTLVGLNAVAAKQDVHKREHGIYLCGTAPLVAVIQQALVDDAWESLPFKKKRDGAYSKKTKTKSKNKLREEVKTFFQFLPWFREAAVTATQPPHEKIAVYDEGQRMWNAERVDKELIKRNVVDEPLGKTEPDHLIGYMDRHEDWSVIIVLAGGGQEIHIGEDGITEWFNSIRKNFAHWNVYLSKEMSTQEYLRDGTVEDLLKGVNYNFVDELYLKTSSRSFRSDKVSNFINAMLAKDIPKAKELRGEINGNYPILLSRDIDEAKAWVRDKRRGTQRAGIFVSSLSHRLRPEGISGPRPNDFPTETWWLDDEKNVDSSQHLELPATEFGSQGLEVDWAIIGWDASLRPSKDGWQYKRFSQTFWKNLDNEELQRFLLNSYRVILTRARQGMVIFVPKGDEKDASRLPEFYDGIYNYLKEIGIKEI